MNTTQNTTTSTPDDEWLIEGLIRSKGCHMVYDMTDTKPYIGIESQGKLAEAVLNQHQRQQRPVRQKLADAGEIEDIFMRARRKRKMKPDLFVLEAIKSGWVILCVKGVPGAYSITVYRTQDNSRFADSERAIIVNHHARSNYGHGV